MAVDMSGHPNPEDSVANRVAPVSWRSSECPAWRHSRACDPPKQIPDTDRVSFIFFFVKRFADAAYLLLLHLQFHLYGLLLVLAALVLEPDTYDTRRQSSHLNQLLLHERIRSRISIVAGSVAGD